jgi:hypothetical protein
MGKVWRAAKEAVQAVSADIPLNSVSGREERTVFCPRCGQLPDGDRRMDEARIKVLSLLDGASAKRSEIDAAISLNYWMVKK